MSSGDTDGSALIKKIAATNYDAVIMDAFVDGGNTPYAASQITSLKTKAAGGNRLIIAYMSIGEAEDYRWYWNSSWVQGNKLTDYAPSWLNAVNPDWKGNYKVKYWNKGWKALIYGNDSSYVKKILDAGFDGVYLDIVDAYEYYEN
jgi:cysteinyl-tRNA synthetase, unknown class